MKLKKMRWVRCLALVAAGFVLLWATAPLMIFPGFFADRPDEEYGYLEQKLCLPAEDGTPLRGWFFNRGSGSPLVVVYTGNNMNAGRLLHLAAEDATRSYLMLNYRGYGDSEGVPSEKRVVADALHCLRLAQNQLGSPASLHVVGYSIGSGVACQVAAAVQPATLTLICPFDSITQVACDFVPLIPRAVLRDTFTSVDYAPRIKCPVTILRAKEDRLVTPPHTDELIKAFEKGGNIPQVHQFDADHSGILTDPGFTSTVHGSLTPPLPAYQFNTGCNSPK